MRIKFVVAAMCVAILATSTATAQVIVVRGAPTVRIQVSPNAKVSIPVTIDMTAAAGTNLASLTSNVTWGTNRLTFDSVRAVGFGSLASNTTNVASGSAVLGTFDAAGTTSTVVMANLYFTTSATTGGTTIAFAATVAGSDVGANILSLIRAQHLDVCVGTSGLWGDVNADGTVNIIDAQQIARFGVGLSVANAGAMTTRGDVTNDGAVNIIDAQQIARFSVGLSAATRVNTAVFVVPTITSVTLNRSTASIPVGGNVSLAATPADASANAMNGCLAVAWTTSAASVATVDSTGRVVGVSPGSATITAVAGGQQAQATIIVGTAGEPASVTVTKGDQQWALYSQPAQLFPEVTVRDAANVPVANVPVTFTVSGGGFNGGSPLTVNTAADGTAAVSAAWTVPNTGTTATMTASIGGAVAPATATVNLVPTALGTATCMYDFWSTRCWGNGTRGQLGNGASANSLTPVTVTNSVALRGTTLTGWGDHFCSFTTTAGQVMCWGSNSAGQLGDGTRTDRSVPTAVAGGLSFNSVATGSYHTCATTTVGDVYCWGLGFYGQLGDSTIGGSSATPVRAKTPVGMVFVDVESGNNHTCARTAAGDVYCWGLNTFGQVGDGTTTPGNAPRAYPVAVTGGLKFSTIAAGGSLTCGLTAAGAAYCWGNNGNGQLGTGTAGGSSATPVAVVGGRTFTQISAGSFRACGANVGGTTDFTVWCWGLSAGAFGDGALLDRPSPTVLPTGVSSIFHGGNNSNGSACGLGFGGQQVWCWGVNGSGQLGDGTSTGRAAPTLVSRADATPGAPVAIQPASISMTPQSGSAGAALPLVPTVVVRDGVGNPVANVTVTWTVLSGGGSVGSATSQTAVDGTATATSWTLGATIGVQMLQASVSGVIVNGSAAPNLLQTFVAYATTAPAGIVRVTPGDSIYVGGVNAAVGVPIVMKVVDGSNNGIANVGVTFSGSLTTGTVTIMTGADGTAALPAGSVSAVTSLLTATAAGLAPATIRVVFPTSATLFGLTSCELTSAGAAYCTGTNSEGAVGDGTTTNRTAFVAVSGGLTFTALADGTSPHKCGLVGTTAYCWGQNVYGQLGDGTRTNRTTPTPVSGGLAFAQIAAYNLTSCGLTTTSQVYCWGWTGTAGWGIGESERARIRVTPTLVNTGGLTFTKITLMDDGMCGITAAGTIHCRGRGSVGFNGDGTTVTRTTFTQWNGGPWKSVDGGNLGVCAIDTSDKAWCLGGSGNNNTALGSTFSGTSAVPLAVSSNVSFVSLHSGNMRACGRTATGEVWCWGLWPGNGTAGNTTPPPTRVPGPPYTSLRQTTFRNACARTANGMLYCWGSNSGGSAGNVGDGTSGIDRTTPTGVVGWPEGPAAGTAVTVVPVTAANVVQSAGSVVAPTPQVIVKDRFGNPVQNAEVSFSVDAGHGTIVGANVTTGADGLAAPTSWTLPTTTPFVAYLKATVDNLPSAVFQATVQPPPASIAAVGASTQSIVEWFTNAGPFSVIVRDAANNPLSGVPVTWNVSVGSGTTTNSAVTNASGIAQLTSWAPPVAVGTPYTVNATVVGLAPVTLTVNRLSWNHATSLCRLNVSGAALCWGGNTEGQVGDNSTTTRTVPTAVSGGHAFTALARGGMGFHQCGLKANGEAWCWGTNDAGQLGNNSLTHSSVPVQVAGGISFASLVTGPYSTCGLNSAGLMYCWGWGSWSFRGDGEFYSIRTTPTLVNTAGMTFTSLAAGLRSICGLNAAGQAFCWGENFGGHLGNGGTASATTPQATSTTLRFTQLTNGIDHTCGVTTTATVACWGWNANGVVGNGTTTNQTTPLVVSGISNAAEVRAGESHNCVRFNDGQLRCWGANGSGQVGDGTNAGPRLAPVTIASGLTSTAIPSMARSSSCAVSAAQLYCWGASSSIGDGTGNSRFLPTAVQWPEASAGAAATVTNSTTASFSAAAGVPQVVTAIVRNHLGAVLAGVTVTFVVSSGGGSVDLGSVVSNASGLATTNWTLAGASGTVGKLEARVTGLPSYVFTGTVP
jgi:alpha-tubulin suppressor-like RCC1 family protein